jgi:hypothetical protein
MLQNITLPDVLPLDTYPREQTYPRSGYELA